MRVCLTGGAGFIGSHILIQLLSNHHDVLVVDNFVNSSAESLRRAQRLVGRPCKLLEEDICNRKAMTTAFSSFQPECVIHCAGLKAVAESHEQPLRYYRNNVEGSVSLLEAMDATGCRQIIFSSSATVYGVAHYLPYDEAHPLAPVNVYGRTKAMIEAIISDWVETDTSRSAVVLRYFNPVGAHVSGEIGEDPKGIPNNLVPFIADVANGKRPELVIFGDDYDTYDGTGIRDYIHVTDLAHGHIIAMDKFTKAKGVEIFNLGSGRGYSVREMIGAFEKASRTSIQTRVAPRRAGDVAISYADISKAAEMLGWKAESSLDDMCADVWRWRSNYPDGYKS